MVIERTRQLIIFCALIPFELGILAAAATIGMSLDKEVMQTTMMKSTVEVKSYPAEPVNAEISDELYVCKLDWGPPIGYEKTKLNYTVYYTVRHLKAFGIYASAKINETGKIHVSRSNYEVRKISLQPYSLYEFTVTANNSKGEGPPCQCSYLQCKTPKRSRQGDDWSQATILTFAFLCAALVIGGCGMPMLVMYCRKRQQMKSSVQQRDELESDTEGQNYMDNVYI